MSGTTSLEVERKYDVDNTASLPDWAALPGVARVGAPEPRALDARYLDTESLDLAGAATALRRRSGGPDAGWHIKRSTAEGKEESHWPLDAEPLQGDPVVPEEIIQVLAPIAKPPFHVIARIQNARTAYALCDASGAMIAEFVDDHVRATDPARGVQTSWREWELELGPAAPASAQGRAELFAAADELVAAVGGSPSASASKLGRALGKERPR